jgi:hypothetical protein
MSDLENLRYPVGHFERLAAPRSRAAIDASIDTIEGTPARYRALVQGRTDAQLDTRYRPGGWTVRQVVHHVPDSHMNAYIRMKVAVTEDAPSIKGYEEALWAELPDGRSAPIASSLELLDALHRRWVLFLRARSEADFLRTYVHPDMGPVPIYEAVALYAWHGQHHTAHIRNALRRAT